MRMGGNDNSNFPISSQRQRTSPSVVLHQLLRELWRTVTLDCHSPPAKKRRVFDFSATQKTINSKAAMNWQNMSTRMGMGAGGNGNCQWEWEGNGNKTRLNLGLGMGMGMNRWEW